jgi:hypothetical protein
VPAAQHRKAVQTGGSAEPGNSMTHDSRVGGKGIESRLPLVKVKTQANRLDEALHVAIGSASGWLQFVEITEFIEEFRYVIR